MDKYLESTHESRFDYDKLISKIKKIERYNEMFSETDFDHDNNHRTFIVDLIIEETVKSKAIHRARELTLSQHKTFVRSAKTHDINFAGQ